jgi:hypothetical protein
MTWSRRRHGGVAPPSIERHINYLGSRFLVCGIRRWELVSQIFSKWNYMFRWPNQLQGLERAVSH